MIEQVASVLEIKAPKVSIPLWPFLTAAALMEFRNVRLPKTEASAGDKEENPEEVEGMILERIYLFEELIRLVNELFRMFLDVRLAATWSEELLRIRGWVAKSAVVLDEK